MKRCLLGLAVALSCWGCSRAPRWPDRVLISSEPVQTSCEPRQWKHGNYLLKALARFDVQGRVLLTENFSSGREAELSPKDLSLGWGKMSQNGYLSQIRLAHIDRYYQWEITGEVPEPETVKNQSANMHFIPADANVAQILKSVRVADLVRAQGFLVEVNAPDGWSWVSSTTRTDSGTGACELIYVEKLEVMLSPPG
jgi:hypothetical protein